MRQRGFELVSAYERSGIALPERKTACSAGYDLAAAVAAELPPGKLALIPTGLKAYMETDEFLGIHIRSSLAIKRGVSLANSQGIIDADYYNNPDNEGHIFIAVRNDSDSPVRIERGERIAQGIFYKYLTADHDTEPAGQRAGGFGSTGR